MHFVCDEQLVLFRRKLSFLFQKIIEILRLASIEIVQARAKNFPSVCFDSEFKIYRSPDTRADLLCMECV